MLWWVEMRMHLHCTSVRILPVAHLSKAVTATLLNFVRLFRKAHEENLKQAESERKKAEKEAEMEKARGINLTKKNME
ncbi:Formin-like protein 20 [Populus alba x Populus x berolinensis]|nr:Formin-like protein 20 [Populus alba x Populus x berolinensis]